jgi:FkbM family methyltransferase
MRSSASGTIFIAVLAIVLFSILYTGSILVQLFHTEIVSTPELVRKHNSNHRHQTRAIRCPHPTNTQSNKQFSKSQSGEDIVLLQWFENLCNGTYIEMGANDGITFSNTYMYNHALHWKGLLIEPNTKSYNALVQNRPHEIALVHAAVCDTEQTVHFVSSTVNLVSGIFEFASPSFRNYWWGNVTWDSPNVEAITCKPLQYIIQDHWGGEDKEPVWIDFFSLDVEGAELQVLQSVNFDKVGFGVIFLEADEHSEDKNIAVREYLISKGYSYTGFEARSDWFVNKDFDTIYSKGIV